MTKQETIKNAYGEHWDKVKQWVDENGWFDYNKAGFELKLYYGTTTYDDVTDGYNGTYEQRPKSLQGIASNNGWVKIESIDDLPKEDCICWVIDKEDNVVFGKWVTPPTEKYFKDASEYWLKRISHYQVIQKPSLPKF